MRNCFVWYSQHSKTWYIRPQYNAVQTALHISHKRQTEKQGPVIYNDTRFGLHEQNPSPIVLDTGHLIWRTVVMLSVLSPHLLRRHKLSRCHTPTQRQSTWRPFVFRVHYPINHIENRLRFPGSWDGYLCKALGEGIRDTGFVLNTHMDLWPGCHV